jgi:hypothetical protein
MEQPALQDLKALRDKTAAMVRKAHAEMTAQLASLVGHPSSQSNITVSVEFCNSSIGRFEMKVSVRTRTSQLNGLVST